MKSFSIFITILAFSFFCAQAQTPAFPGAEGHGRYTTGGRGGTVYHVTTLEDTGLKGSLRYAVAQKGARTIVFDVAGTIFLRSTLKISNDDITIAGQTAPGQGICIAGWPVSVSANNVIIRYLRFRMGNESGEEEDALGGWNKKNIIVDHCSISWSVDECCSLYGSDNLTLQWCIVSESLRTAGHEKGTHGYGGNWGGARASYHHNLLAHHDSRSPRLGPKSGTQTREYMDMRNNVIYNWSGNGCYGGEGMKVNIVNNYYKPGPSTKSSATSSKVRYRIASVGIRTESYVSRYPEFAPMKHVWGKYYVDGNVIEGYPDVTNDNWTKGIYEQVDESSCDGLFTEVTKDTIKLRAPLETDVITTHTATQALGRVLLYAGCSLSRDEIDTRIVKETEYGTTTYVGSISKDAAQKPGLIDVPNDVKPAGAASAWPELSDGGVTEEQLRDTDGDGIPDVWEDAHGLNKNNAADGKTVNAEGYTNLEVYMNSLVAEITENQNKAIDYTPIVPTSLETLLANASVGDVLEVTSEVVGKELTIDKNITIKAQSGLLESPVLEKVTFKVLNGASVTLDGLTLFYDRTGSTPTDSKYLISVVGTAQTIPLISFKNCEIYGYGRGAVRADDKTNIAAITKLEVENSVFHDMCKASPNYSVLGFSKAELSAAEITNSSFFNCAGGVFVNGGAVPLNFKMKNVTILDCGTDADETLTGNAARASNDIIATGACEGSVYRLENCIISGYPTKKVALNNDAYIENSLIANEVSGSLLLDGRLDASIVSKDYASYTLTTDHAIGSGIGDLRWTVNSAEPGGIEPNRAQDDVKICVAGGNAGGNVRFIGLSGTTQVDAYALNGGLVLTKLGDGETLSFDLSSGLYLLRVVTGKQVYVFRVYIR